MIYSSSLNDLYSSYRFRAAKKKLDFTLSKLEFQLLTSCNCYYCGSVPRQIKDNSYKPVYVYNGIDRLNSSFGYESHNCVSCCFVCNRAKGTLTTEEFEKWLQKITTNYQHISIFDLKNTPCFCIGFKNN